MTWTTLIGCLVVIAAGPCDLAVVTLHEEALIEGRRIELGEVAKVVGEGKQAEALAATDIGPAPLPGSSREVSVGYVKMRLRRAGVDCGRLRFEGAEEVRVRCRAVAVSADADGEQPGSVAGSQQARSEAVEVPRGTRVRLAVICGAVRIVADAVTLEDATVGMRAKMRVEQTRQTVVAELTGSTEALMRQE